MRRPSAIDGPSNGTSEWDDLFEDTSMPITEPDEDNDDATLRQSINSNPFKFHFKTPEKPSLSRNVLAKSKATASDNGALAPKISTRVETPLPSNLEATSPGAEPIFVVDSSLGHIIVEDYETESDLSKWQAERRALENKIKSSEKRFGEEMKNLQAENDSLRAEKLRCQKQLEQHRHYSSNKINDLKTEIRELKSKSSEEGVAPDHSSWTSTQSIGEIQAKRRVAELEKDARLFKRAKTFAEQQSEQYRQLLMEARKDIERLELAQNQKKAEVDPRDKTYQSKTEKHRFKHQIKARQQAIGARLNLSATTLDPTVPAIQRNDSVVDMPASNLPDLGPINQIVPIRSDTESTPNYIHQMNQIIENDRETLRGTSELSDRFSINATAGGHAEGPAPIAPMIGSSDSHTFRPFADAQQQSKRGISATPGSAKRQGTFQNPIHIDEGDYSSDLESVEQ